MHTIRNYGIEVELEGGQPTHAIIWMTTPKDNVPIQIAREDFGPFDDAWDFVLWLHRTLRESTRQSRGS